MKYKRMKNVHMCKLTQYVAVSAHSWRQETDDSLDTDQNHVSTHCTVLPND